jgi:hypothetical protein
MADPIAKSTMLTVAAGYEVLAERIEARVRLPKDDGVAQ